MKFLLMLSTVCIFTLNSAKATKYDTLIFDLNERTISFNNSNSSANNSSNPIKYAIFEKHTVDWDIIQFIKFDGNGFGSTDHIQDIFNRTKGNLKRVILSDCYEAGNADEIQKFCEKFKVKLKLVNPYFQEHHSANIQDQKIKKSRKVNQKLTADEKQDIKESSSGANPRDKGIIYGGFTKYNDE